MSVDGQKGTGERPKVGMVCFSYYPDDVRPRRECEALVEAGFAVDMICLRAKGEKPCETVAGVGVYRLPITRKRGSKIKYVLDWAAFFILSGFVLSYLHLKKRYRLIQIHNMPDFLVFVAILPRLLGVKVLLDLHDPTPEVFMAKYGVPDSHFFTRLLRMIEKGSIGFASHVITPNLAFRELFAARSCARKKIDIVMNSPQESVFGSGDGTGGERKQTDEFVVMYHGTVAERLGLDVALDAIDRVARKMRRIRFLVYGEGDYVTEFQKRVLELGLEDVVEYHGRVPLETIAKEIETIDLGVIPNRVSCFTNLNFPTRIFEYLCKRKPVIVPKTRGISDYFDDQSLFYCKGGDPESLAEKIWEVYKGGESVAEVVNRGYVVYEQHRWEKEKERYSELAGRLAGGR